MPKKQNSKEKILTIRVSQSQYEKICALADIREMNVTEYIRHTAIGNRIKPTVIEQIKESSEVSELFKKDNEALKSNNQALQHHIHQLEIERTIKSKRLSIIVVACFFMSKISCNIKKLIETFIDKA